MRLATTLRARLVLLSTGVTAAALLIALTLLYVSLSRTLTSAVDQGLRDRAESAVTVVQSTGGELPESEFLTQLLLVDGTVLRARGVSPAEPVLSDAARARAVAEGGVFVNVDLPVYGRVRLFGTPVEVSTTTDVAPGVLVVATDLSTVTRLRARLLLVLLLTLPFLVALLGAAVYLVVRSALRPVDALTREAARVSEADDDRRLPEPATDDEIGRLASTLNGMLDRIAVGVRRERAFVDDASHELRTPVAVLRGELELALSALDEPKEVEESVRAAHAESVRLARLSEDLLVLARERDGSLLLRPETVDLAALVTQAVRRVAGLVGADVVAVVPDEPVHVLGDALRLEQVVDNLVVNADTAGATRVEVRTEAAPDCVVLAVGDDGPGFPEDFRSTAFERFTRGDVARTRTGGAGLGLAIVAAVARAHGGRVSLGTDPQLGGAGVALRLPAAPDPDR